MVPGLSRGHMMERQLDTSNVCTSCQEDASDAFLPCTKCKGNFHVLRCGERNPKLCTATFLDGWKSLQENYRNIQFLCDNCLEETITSSDADTSNRDSQKMTDIEERLATLNDEFKVLKTSLKQRKPAKEVRRRDTTHIVTAERPAANGIGNATTEAAVDDEIHTEVPVAADIPVTEFENLSQKDRSRTINFGKTLRTLGRMPKNIDSLMLLDSNGRKLCVNEIDPTGHTDIRSTGGLCLPATVHGLKYYKRKHTNIKHVYYGIGTNDALHQEEHAPNERINYVKLLHKENQRIFPNAKLTFLLPPAGVNKVDIGYINSLASDIKEANVPIRQLRTPNMRGKVQLPNKVHYNDAGVRSVTDWIQKILPNRPRSFSLNSGRRSDTTMFSGNPRGEVYNHVWANSDSSYARSVNYRNNSHSFSPPSQQQSLPTPSSQPPQNSVEPKMVQDVVEFLAKLMANK